MCIILKEKICKFLIKYGIVKRGKIVDDYVMIYIWEINGIFEIVHFTNNLNGNKTKKE